MIFVLLSPFVVFKEFVVFSQFVLEFVESGVLASVIVYAEVAVFSEFAVFVKFNAFSVLLLFAKSMLLSALESFTGLVPSTFPTFVEFILIETYSVCVSELIDEVVGEFVEAISGVNVLCFNVALEETVGTVFEIVEYRFEDTVVAEDSLVFRSKDVLGDFRSVEEETDVGRGDVDCKVVVEDTVDTAAVAKIMLHVKTLYYTIKNEKNDLLFNSNFLFCFNFSLIQLLDLQIEIA